MNISSAGKLERVDSPLVVFYGVILNIANASPPSARLPHPHEYSYVIFQENRISMMNRTFTEMESEWIFTVRWNV